MLKSPFVVVSLLLVSSTVAAQPWVGEPGSLGFGVGYSFASSGGLIERIDGEKVTVPNIDIVNHTVTGSLSYVPLENLSLNLSLPLMLVNTSAQPAHGRYDDGNTHTTLQDARLDARYALLNSQFGAGVGVGVSVPAVDYETRGFAAAGRGLRRLHLNASVGLLASDLLPGLFARGSYEYSFVERLDVSDVTRAIPQDTSSVGTSVGYAYQAITVSADATFRVVHGGVNFDDLDPANAVIWDNHDALLNEDLLIVGPTVSLGVMDGIAVSVFGRMVVWGENTRNSKIAGLSVDFLLNDVFAEPAVPPEFDYARLVADASAAARGGADDGEFSGAEQDVEASGVDEGAVAGAAEATLDDPSAAESADLDGQTAKEREAVSGVVSKTGGETAESSAQDSEKQGTQGQPDGLASKKKKVESGKADASAERAAAENKRKKAAARRRAAERRRAAAEKAKREAARSKCGPGDTDCFFKLVIEEQLRKKFRLLRSR